MNFTEYKELAMRTNDGKCTERLDDKLARVDETIIIGDLMNASLGLSGEVGELNDMIKKWIFHGHDLDLEEVGKEIGDILWYIALVCNAFNFDLDKVANANIEKLRKRYPEGFSEKASINRKEYINVEGLQAIIDYQENMKHEE